VIVTLSIAFRHVFPSLPGVISSQGTSAVAVICRFLSLSGTLTNSWFHSLNQNKSRRKSCQACAESKVKCDLKQPCTKCTSRGKECIFINDPAQSREKKAAAAARRNAAQKATADASSTSSASPRLSPLLPSGNPMLYPSAYSYDIEQDTELSLVTEHNSASFDISPISPIEPFFKHSYSATYPELSGGSTTTNSSMSPRSEIFDIAADYYAAGREMHLLDESLSKLMSQDMAPLCPEPSLVMQPSDFVHASQGLLDFCYETQPQWMMDSVRTGCSPLDVDPYIAPLSDDAMSASISPLNNGSPSSLLVAQETPTIIDISPNGTPVGPAEAELQHYCERCVFPLSIWRQPLTSFPVYLFHTAFRSHVPIVHPSTWAFEGKTPILSRATQACGAQFVNNQVARDFVSQVLHSTCESLLQAVRVKLVCFSIFLIPH